jgi:hypothetical protein
MPSTHLPNPLHQDCLGYLQKILDLAMHTAEAASAEGNHKIVLQAVREVTRIITLITKMTRNPDQEARAATKIAPSPVNTIPDQDMDLLQDILPDLFQQTAAKLMTEKPHSKKEKRFFRKREKSGK